MSGFVARVRFSFNESFFMLASTVTSTVPNPLFDEIDHLAFQAHAVKRVLAWQIEQAMTQQGISKSEMAKRMHTSRAQLDRLLGGSQ